MSLLSFPYLHILPSCPHFHFPILTYSHHFLTFLFLSSHIPLISSLSFPYPHIPLMSSLPFPYPHIFPSFSNFHFPIFNYPITSHFVTYVSLSTRIFIFTYPLIANCLTFHSLSSHSFMILTYLFRSICSPGAWAIDNSSSLGPVLCHRYLIPGVDHLLQFGFHIMPPGVFGPSSFPLSLGVPC